MEYTFFTEIGEDLTQIFYVTTIDKTSSGMNEIALSASTVDENMCYYVDLDDVEPINYFLDQIPVTDEISSDILLDEKMFIPRLIRASHLLAHRTRRMAGNYIFYNSKYKDIIDKLMIYLADRFTAVSNDNIPDIVVSVKKNYSSLGNNGVYEPTLFLRKLNDSKVRIFYGLKTENLYNKSFTDFYSRIKINDA